MKRLLLVLFQLSIIVGIPLVGQTVDNAVDLQNAIDNVSEGSTIILSSSFPKEISATITILVNHDKNFTIDGGLEEYKTTGDFRYFTIDKTNIASTGSITFDKFHFIGRRLDTNGISKGNPGGGVSIKGSSNGTIQFINSSFKSISDTGLSIGSTDATVICKNTSFINNWAFGHGGGINISGTTNVIIESCTFDQNYGDMNGGHSGGAICFFQYNTGGVASISKSVFTNNTANQWGGAIGIYAPGGGTVNIDECYFTGNSTRAANGNGDGGAISLHGGNINHSAKFTLSNSTFYKNIASDDGGAVYIQNAGSNAENNIINCTMFENESRDANPATTEKFGIKFNIATSGGAIQVSLPTTITLHNNTIVRNYTTSSYQRGGGIGFHANTDGAPTFHLKNNIILGNYIKSGINEITNVDANFGGRATVNPTFPTNTNNIGFDNGKALASNVNLKNVFGTDALALTNNHVEDNIQNRVGNSNETNPEYFRIIPTISILPNDDEHLKGLADGSIKAPPSQPTDQRGYNRITPDSTDVGAVEILWVRFDANGGTWTGLDNSFVYDGMDYYEPSTTADIYFKVTYSGGKVTLPSATLTPPVAGQVPTWVIDDGSDDEWKASDAIIANVKVKALWDVPAITYTVTYEPNAGAGGIGTPYIHTTTYNLNDSHTIMAHDHTDINFQPQTDYSFVSWNTQADGGGTSYAPGATLTIDGNKVLHAIWKKDTNPPVDPPKPPVPPVDPEDPEEPTPNPDQAITVGDIADFCFFDKEFRIPFILHYTKEELKYTILFSQEAKDAGFVDITDQKVLSGSYITVPVSASIPAGVYQGTIQLHASANANIYRSYTFTIRVMDIVRITKQPVSVTNKCEGDGLVLSVTATGINLTYQWFLEGQRIEGATNDTYSTVLSRGKEGFYHVEVYGDCGYEVSDSADVRISGLIILMKWDDVMYVSNVDNKYKRFQWYLNGEAITTHGTSIYYTNPQGLQGTYFVRAYKADDSYDESCSLTFTEATRAATVSIYPNPVQQYTYLNIESPEAGESFIGSKVDVYDMAGRKVYSTTATGQKIQIPANMALGVHVVHITMKNGKVISQKVVVK